MHPNLRRPRLTPAMADARRAVRELLASALPAAPRAAPAIPSGAALDGTSPVGVAPTRAGPVGAAPVGAEPAGAPRPQAAPSAATDPSIRRPAASLAPAVPPPASETVPAAAAAEADPLAAERAPLVLVGLSGGPDSLALAVALAFEAPRAGLRAGAVIVDHGLQQGSGEVAARAAAQARGLGLEPVVIELVKVGTGSKSGGPEAAARDARYAAFERVASETGAAHVLLAHTLDDQAETVLLGLARGSGPVSLRGMAPVNGLYLRPLLGIRRQALHQSLADAGGGEDHRGTGVDADRIVASRPGSEGFNLNPATSTPGGCEPPDSGQASSGRSGTRPPTGPEALAPWHDPLNDTALAPRQDPQNDRALAPWHDPQNDDTAFARVRVRTAVLPVLERELGPGIAEALARTAEQLREDTEALDALAAEWAAEIVEHAEAGISIDVHGLASNPAALAHRIIRFVVASEFGVSLSRAHTVATLRLVTEWRGQAGVDLPGIHVSRTGAHLVFARTA